MSTPYGGPPSGPYPQQPYGPPSGPQPQQPYGPPSGPPAQLPYAAPVPGQPYGQPGGYGPSNPFQGQTADWGTRVLGYLIDGAIPTGIYLLFSAIMWGISVAILGSGTPKTSTLHTYALVATIVGVILWIGLIGFTFWNLAYKRGTTGQTIGQKVVKIKTISEETGQPLGFGGAFLRQICHFVDSIACSIGYLAPLWDEKNQTWADKIVKSVVIRVDPATAGMPPQPGMPGGYPQQSGAQPGMPPQPGAYPQQPGAQPGMSGGYPPPQQGRSGPYGQPPQQW